MMPVSDTDQRRRALDPERSFIVQSPAGSGKTELLIQRYLTLLGTAMQPEEITAITFTRKAAGEMRRRIMNALLDSSGPRPAEPHRALTWDLARRARERSDGLNWRLAENPGRLRIQTIDALCASITRQMPWLSRLGGAPAIMENAKELYLEAARATVELLEDDRWSTETGILLAHVDNDFRTLETLLAGMLERRDQWLRHIASTGDQEGSREALELALHNVIVDAVNKARASVPEGLSDHIVEISAKAGKNLRAEGRDVPAVACADMVELPGPDDLNAWLGIADTLLTMKGEWRKTVTVRNGFPSSDKPFKQRAVQLISALVDAEPFRLSLDELRYLPDPGFSTSQWQVLAALVKLLPAASEQLRYQFQNYGVCDFVEVSMAARRSLTASENSAEFAGRIRHILIDEFQDTSVSQFSLLEALIADWQPGDGRTIFAVGDPMQSIYRFREAEVGLFLKTSREGIAGVPLELVRLSANFRSERGIVDWVNDSFGGILAAEDDITTGAIQFCRSEAVHGVGLDPAVLIHPFFGRNDDAEAALVVDIIRAAKAAGRGKTAILVRARNHLTRIVPALRAANLRFRAVEIDPLAELPAIRDLTALTRALMHRADRVAWLALLRAPWCGMTLEELHTLAGADLKRVIWDLMNDESQISRLGPEASRRLLRIRSVLREALEERPRSLRTWVEGVWLGLGGPACCSGSENEDASTFFHHLEQMDEGGSLDIAAFEERIAQLYADPDPDADESLQIMSIHKAKGLEFDVVIVPGMGRKPVSDDSRLMLWLERPRLGKTPDLLLAPIHAAGAEKDKIYDYLKRVNDIKSEHECGRLLYVAATRARRELHLIGHTGYLLKNDVPQLREPASASLLKRMWGVAEPVFLEAFQRFTTTGIQTSPPERTPQTIERLVSGWRLPALPPGVQSGGKRIRIESDEVRISFRWVGDTLRHIGTVVHEMLRRIANDGLSRWSEERLRSHRPAYLAGLAALGVPSAELAESADKVERALVRAVSDERGKWLLDDHQGAACEYSISGVVEGRIVTARIDRTFIDREGTRWVIDYKSSSHEGAGIDDFLDNERERYREQMLRYHTLFTALDDRPVRTALYFPLLNAWREVV